MFNRRANDFEIYTAVDPNFDNSVIKPEDIALQYKKVHEFLIPALYKRIQHTQEKDRARFIKTHKIIEDKFPLNSTVMIKNVSRNVYNREIAIKLGQLPLESYRSQRIPRLAAQSI
ncbi:hypothetical protein BD770DRAFT_454249 [Pilaira anomala]|nr:hypothetical protein BD770DRAFT_454249 [Pilaira anomala]